MYPKLWLLGVCPCTNFAAELNRLVSARLLLKRRESIHHVGSRKHPHISMVTQVRSLKPQGLQKEAQ